MRLVLQRAARTSVCIDGRTIADISKGLLILVGAEKQDNPDKAHFLADKVLTLRVFPDAQRKMNLSCLDISGEVLVVSRFTLTGDCAKGRRPGFGNAAKPKEAESLYRQFIEKVSRSPA